MPEGGLLRHAAMLLIRAQPRVGGSRLPARQGGAGGLQQNQKGTREANPLPTHHHDLLDSIVRMPPLYGSRPPEFNSQEKNCPERPAEW